MAYIILRGRWCHINVLNVHVHKENKINYVKDSFFEEIERVFDKFLKHHTEISLGNFNVKVGRKDFFKPTTRNVNLHEIHNDNRVRVVNTATSKNHTVKIRCSHILVVTFINLINVAISWDIAPLSPYVN
jgi:hypothetical protein